MILSSVGVSLYQKKTSPRVPLFFFHIPPSCCYRLCIFSVLHSSCDGNPHFMLEIDALPLENGPSDCREIYRNIFSINVIYFFDTFPQPHAAFYFSTRRDLFFYGSLRASSTTNTLVNTEGVCAINVYNRVSSHLCSLNRGYV